MKKIVILNGSPRPKGNTSVLIDEFTKGAEAAGHKVIRFDVSSMNIHGCKGCLGGGKDQMSPCVQKDDMDLIYPSYKEADIIVLASPMYFWSITGQLKCTFDRLFAVMESDPNFAASKKDCIMLMAAEDASPENFKPIEDYYNALLNWLGWNDLGMIKAGGVAAVGDIKGKPVLEEAFALGKSIS